jgi:hypothetical protein
MISKLRCIGFNLMLLCSFCLCINEMSAQLATQVGIGALFINGDIDPVKDAVNSFHIGLSKEIKNNLNAEIKFGLGKAIGLSGAHMRTTQFGGGLIEQVYSFYEELPWYPNYIADYKYLDISANYILNTGISRLRFIGGAGIGISFSSISLNLLDPLDNRYSILYPDTDPIDDVKSKLDFRYDPTYETRWTEGGSVVPHISLQLGMQFRITRGIYFSADIRYHLTASDYLDPITNVSTNEGSGNNDSVSIITIGFVGYLLPYDKEEKELVK